MTTQAMVPVQQGQNAPMALIGGEKLQLLTDTICKGASAGELGMFVEVCNRLRLDPFAKQIHAVKRWDSALQREVFSFQVGIDGFRLVAQRTGEMDGIEGPLWCGEDGEWLDLWTRHDPPFACKVLVYRKGISRPFPGVAKFDSYVGRKKDGTPNSMWQKFPDLMIAKCAEALALRRAFPAELSGVYSDAEMDQAGEAVALPAPAAAPIQRSQPKKLNPPPASPEGAVKPPAAEAKPPASAAAQPSGAPASSAPTTGTATAPAAAPSQVTPSEATVGVLEEAAKTYQPPKDKEGNTPPAKKYSIFKVTVGGEVSEMSSWDSEITKIVRAAMEAGNACHVEWKTNAKGNRSITKATVVEPGSAPQEEPSEAEMA